STPPISSRYVFGKCAVRHAPSRAPTAASAGPTAEAPDQGPAPLDLGEQLLGDRLGRPVPAQGASSIEGGGAEPGAQLGVDQHLGERDVQRIERREQSR